MTEVLAVIALGSAVAILGTGAGWLFSYSLIRLMAYHSRRISVATLYLQWARNA